MPLHVTWTDIAVRLALTVLAGAVIGFDRSERGKIAGMRTAILVAMAAAAAMIEVNQLLATAGRPHDSFVMNDLMRFPLGILTGVGFIGGGAILRRGDMVLGVTTAATLWLVTMIGLCIGAGLIGLGIATTAIGVAVLWGLQPIEARMVRCVRARLTVQFDENSLTDTDVRSRLARSGLRVRENGYRYWEPDHRITLTFDVDRIGHRSDPPPDAIRWLAQQSGVRRIEWHANS